jgi:4-carboxymuconolactone decarboxylase
MDAHAIGRNIMVDLMGAEYVESRESKQRNEFNSVLQDYSTEVCFGRIWARDGLDRKFRSVINIAMLTALNRPSQLRHHIEGALNNGCTVREIQEILLQSAVYCGLPAAGEAFKVAEQVLKEHKLLK